jgi:L-fuculokinase
MKKALTVVMDCGSTNAAVIAVDDQGRLVHSASRPNASAPQPGGEEGWRIWDVDQIWGKLSDACREVCAEVEHRNIQAVTVCTFGADGALMGRDGTLTYPAICWQDTRTEPLVSEIAERMDAWTIFAKTGYQIIPFNTLLRLMWLRKHAPQALDQAECYLMMPGLLSFKLSGERSIDPTCGGTTMAMELGGRDWSEQMLALADVDVSLFPRWVEPGAVIGHVHKAASERTGLPVGIPVIAAGHDTQFAAIGSGASPEEAILSSGTWEIVMLRIAQFTPNRFGFEEGLLYECDAVAGFCDPQLLMMGSGALEWMRKHFYADLGDGGAAYTRMIEDAENVSPGSGGVTVLPSFVAETGPTKKYHTHGTILGITPTTDRGQLYRAALEGLSFQLRHALDTLTQATGFEAQGIRIVGGGSRNALWNQIRADVTGLPVTTIAEKEATVLGAALFAFYGAGHFASLEEAQERAAKPDRIFEPSEHRAIYEDLFARYLKAPVALEGFYRS